jgi:hypothetical protein
MHDTWCCCVVTSSPLDTKSQSACREASSLTAALCVSHNCFVLCVALQVVKAVCAHLLLLRRCCSLKAAGSSPCQRQRHNWPSTLCQVCMASVNDIVQFTEAMRSMPAFTAASQHSASSRCS